MTNWPDADEELPAWVNALSPRPCPIDTEKLTEDELIAEFEKLFVALLQKADSTNSLEGWRDVAVDLALEFHPAFEIKVRKKLPVSGRPITPFLWMIKNAFLSRKRKLEREAARETDGTRWESKPIQKGAQAAREVAKEWGAAELKARAATRGMSAEMSDDIDTTPSAKRIQNMAPERIPFPADWTANDYLLQVKSAAWAAARRITEV
jgi:hypothetical protein